MPNEFNQYFNRLLTALRAAEVQQKKRYDDAIDIEDMSEATAVTIDARNKIQQLRKWIEDLQRISNEVETTFSAVPSSTHKSDDMAADFAPQAIAELERQDSDENSSASQAEDLPLPVDEKAESENDDVVGLPPIISQVELASGETTVDDDAFGPLSIEGFTLFGKQYNTSSWQELLIRLCETMVLKKPYKIASLGANAHLTQLGRPILSLNGQQIESYQKLSNGLFVDTGGSDHEIKTRCEHILSACGYSSDVLQIL